MSKILCIVQARMGSTRLPGKVIKEVCGKPLLSHLIDRLKQCTKISQIIIATTNLGEDNIIEKVAEENNVYYFRGSENNVLSRYYLAMKEFKGDIVVRVTSDCPLIDPNLIDDVIDFFEKNQYDYVSPRSKDGLIRGLDVEVFSRCALEKAYNQCSNKIGLEHVTWFMYNNPKEFSIKNFKVPIKFKYPEIRLCVDEIKDFEKIQHIYNKFYKGDLIDTEKVIDYLLENPHINNINFDVMQKKI